MVLQVDINLLNPAHFSLCPKKVSRSRDILIRNDDTVLPNNSSVPGFDKSGKTNVCGLFAASLLNHKADFTYVLKCSEKIRLVEVPVSVVSPPMVEE